MVLLVIAKINDLDIEFVDTNPNEGLSDKYKAMNPLRRVPTFEAADGWVLTEVIAIANYLASQKPESRLLGHDARDHAEIFRWMSFVNMEVLEKLIRWFRPFIGTDPFVPEAICKAKDASLEALRVLEKHLSTRRFFLGDEISLADYFAASLLARGFQFVLDAEWRQLNPGTTTWFKAVVDQPVWREVVGQPILIDHALTKALSAEDAKVAQGLVRVQNHVA